MLVSSVPYKFTQPWGSSATTGYITSPIPATAGGANASQALGFPPITAAPVGSGGVPPNVSDFNGLGSYVTTWLQWVQAGGPVQYDAAFSTAIGGYPKGATLANASTLGKFWISETDNNTSDPDTGGANWLAFPTAPPNIYPVGNSTTATTTSISSTTPAMVAPSKGYAMVYGCTSIDPLASNLLTAVLSASLGGLVGLTADYNGNLDQQTGYLPMTTGQSATFTMVGTQTNPTIMTASVNAFFVPLP